MAEAKETGQAETEERSPEQIQAEIEETREELAGTVEAVAEKADVKAQAKQKVEETKTQAKEKIEETKASAEDNRVPIAIAMGVAGGLFLLWRRRRR
jgi:hypothetical protein